MIIYCLILVCYCSFHSSRVVLSVRIMCNYWFCNFLIICVVRHKGEVGHSVRILCKICMLTVKHYCAIPLWKLHVVPAHLLMIIMINKFI